MNGFTICMQFTSNFYFLLLIMEEKKGNCYRWPGPKVGDSEESSCILKAYALVRDDLEACMRRKDGWGLFHWHAATSFHEHLSSVVKQE